MRYRSSIKLPVGCSAIPGGLVNDDSAVVFHIEPVGIRAIRAAAPYTNSVCVIDNKISIALEHGICAGVSVCSGAPGPSVVGKIINVKIPVGRHVEQVLAVRRG